MWLEYFLEERKKEKNTHINLVGIRESDLKDHRVIDALNNVKSAKVDINTMINVDFVTTKLPKVTELDFSRCTSITNHDVEVIAIRLPHLTSINLYECKNITSECIKAIVEHLKLLTYLDMSWCSSICDSDVKAIANKLQHLKCLRLSRCDLITNNGAVEIAMSLPDLEVLDLAWCEDLSLDCTKVMSQKMTKLRHLDLRGCFKLKIPVELTSSQDNPTAILDYCYRASTENKQPLNEAKLIIIGNESVGKTSLVNFLVNNKPCDDSPKTPGVQIVDGVKVNAWDVSQQYSGGTPLRLNVWDFGGQEVLKETHKFFLTARSLYLLVLEARRENITDADERIHEWLRTIRNYTKVSEADPDVPIIIVVNKCDAGHDLRLDVSQLQNDYPSIIKVIRTCCLSQSKDAANSGKGIIELRSSIVKAVREKLPHVGTQVPESYFKVMEELRHLAKSADILSTRKYQEICNRHTIIRDTEQDNLLDLLDAIGVVVKYDDTTLLEPNWLTTAVYRILTHSDVVKAGGEFSLGDIGLLLTGLPTIEKYPKDRWKFIAEMMRRFQLSFELPEKPGRYLVPEQLPVNRPGFDWDEDNSLRFRFDYDYLPRGLLPRFIVEAHAYLPKDRIAWIHGVVIQIDGCMAFLRADQKDKRIHIFIRGPQQHQRLSLAAVIVMLTKVHRLNREVKAKAMVPVNVPGCVDAAIEYDMLKTLEANAEKNAYFAGYNTPFNVSELISGVGQKLDALRDDSNRHDNLSNIVETRRLEIGGHVPKATRLTSDLSHSQEIAIEPISMLPTSISAKLSAIIASVVSVVLGGVWLLIREQGSKWYTGFTTVVVLVFLSVYLLFAWIKFRREHWPLALTYTFAAATLSAIPGLFHSVASMFGLHPASSEISPLVFVSLALLTVVFALFQFFRERL